MSLRTLIADDEPTALARLRQLLVREPGIEIVAECTDGFQTLKAIEEKKPHLVFLDIQMPVLDGFEVLEQIQLDLPPSVIFVTAHDHYAVKAFEASALDYLLKPYDVDRFKQALRRALEKIETTRKNQALKSALQAIRQANPSPRQPARVAIREAGRVIVLNATEIDWVQSADNYVEFHVGTNRHLQRKTIESLAQNLPPEKFLRISRSQIVNVDRIKSIQPLSHGDYAVLLHDGTELRASRKYRQALVEIMGGEM